MLKRLFFVLFIVCLFASCNNRTMYSEFQSMPISGWSADSVLVFNVEVDDTLNAYDIIIDVRHSTSYPYQNMWLFINTDTIDFYLANHRGEWLGNGGGELREMPVLYKRNIRFNTIGCYTYKITQAMRDKNLRGIRDIGIIVNRHE